MRISPKYTPKPFAKRKKKPTMNFYCTAKEVAEATGMTERGIKEMRKVNVAKYYVLEVGSMCYVNNITPEMLMLLLQFKEEFKQLVMRG